MFCKSDHESKHTMTRDGKTTSAQGIQTMFLKRVLNIEICTTYLKNLIGIYKRPFAFNDDDGYA